MYLFRRLKSVKMSVSASATWSLSMSAAAFLTVSIATVFRSSSKGVAASVFLKTPPKYLLAIATVRLTRFPRMFARSEL